MMFTLPRFTKKPVFSKLVLSFLLILFTSSCQSPASGDQSKEPIQTAYLSIDQEVYFPRKYVVDQLYDFGDPRFDLLIQKLKRAGNERVHMLQLGDSHTAADLFTGELRSQFQARFGHGGIGLIPPGSFNAIRHNDVKISSGQDWGKFSMRAPEGRTFPITGYLTTPLDDDARISIASRKEEDSTTYKASLLYHARRESRLDIGGKSLFLNSQENSWAFSEAISNLRLPMQLQLKNHGEFYLGGIFLESQKNAGVMLSSLGVNGATLMDWEKFTPNFQESFKAIKPDLVILAYGTNEAFAANLNLADYRALLVEKIRVLRLILPQTTILIVGAPDSLKGSRKVLKNSDVLACQTQRPPMLAGVVDVQRDVARQEKTLYWDWQEAMGGLCSMIAWNQKGLARDDWVHFSAEGYAKSAQMLYRAFLGLAGLR